MTETPFDDLQDYVAFRRVSGLALSPDGTRLVVSVSTLDEKRTGQVSSLWELDPAGARPARRLTWGPKSETDPVFLVDGALLFRSARPDPEAAAGDEPPTSLWLLPAGGGEARPVVTLPGGVGPVVAARDVPLVVLSGPVLSASGSVDDDGRRRKARTDRKVTAVLHDSYPVRYWNSDLGPDRGRLFAAGFEAGEGRPDLRDLTGHVGRALDAEASWSLSADGTRVVSSWQRAEAGGSARQVLVVVDVADGARRVLLDDPTFDYILPSVSPDGSKVALALERRSDPQNPIDVRLSVLHLDSGEVHDAAPDWDRWPTSAPVWTPDGGALLVTADDDGRGPVWRIDLDSRTATRLTGDDGAYSELRLARDGSALYALRSAVDGPPAPVRLDPARPGQQPVRLPGPVPDPALPGTVRDVETTAADGTRVRGWLAVPHGASAAAPAPLLLWVHGGPLGSWNAWSWRWNPWLAVARGYAVLLPDPALSTGYGLAAIRRGWGRWGSESFTDLMAVTDAAVALDEVDGERTAAMGGSFGGYMANWIAGHTDRFRGIVSHAGLWALDSFGPTTDAAYYWRREMTAEMSAEHSPHRFVGEIRTPMLVIHGDQDYRVPVGEALRLWTELAEQGTADDGVLPHRFLLFPDENHWVLKPQNARVWYDTVFAFLAHTVLDRPWEAPDVLR